MAIKIDRLYLNPMGRGVFGSNVGVTKKEYDDIYKNIISKDIKGVICYGVEKTDYVFHIKVPSEQNHNLPDKYKLYYDVVFEFRPFTEQNTRNIILNQEDGIIDYGINLFSNSPSFIYGGYTFLFRTGNSTFKIYPSLIKWGRMLEKYSKIAYNTLATIKNPYNILTTFEKSLYFALTFIIQSGWLKKNMLLSDISNSIKIDSICRDISSQEDKLIEVRRATKIISEANKNKPKDKKIVRGGYRRKVNNDNPMMSFNLYKTM